MANIIGQPDGPFQAACARTIAQVFSHVYVVNPYTAIDNSAATLIVVAASSPLPWEQWRTSSPLPVTVEERPVAGGSLVLTDDYVPVDNLLLPVFVQRWHR